MILGNIFPETHLVTLLTKLSESSGFTFDG
jgi:hypothetical protein